MLEPSYINRFNGVAKLYGQAALETYATSHVAVVGIGGVGSWVAEGLARSGIGQITLIDLDDICVSNTNRQIHTLADNIGQSKVAVMAARLRLINPDLIVNEVEDFIDLDNIPTYIQSHLNYVVDAIDSVISKSALIAYCRRHKIPIITIGGAGGQINPGQIRVKDLSRADIDPLLAKVRNELRRKYHFPRNVKRRFYVEAVYSEEQIIYPWPNGELRFARPKQSVTKLDCADGLGAISFVTGSFAFFAVAQVLKHLHPCPVK
ncbi:MAG: tRNA cyclic N6-threonylcarbamoyladenosine(37) synthase TcdA [Gammaproteobacteria bacterium CG22_combo_CG10-13_8_21_14_all_40_8]|nr:MAG: tRNA cyclic N6-threonylcarbamoyladenosine(37) synthase TcdA [Gammaproteobacteria bacterium CG22_combo_CG10-13_8_21_14_all_40_8]